MRPTEFVVVGDRLVNINAIKYVDMTNLEKLELKVVYDGGQGVVSHLWAIDLLMLLRPSAMEGKKLRWLKNEWILHNLVAHPVMQLLALCKFTKLGLWLHDITVPRPFGAKKENEKR